MQIRPDGAVEPGALGAGHHLLAAEGFGSCSETEARRCADVDRVLSWITGGGVGGGGGDGVLDSGVDLPPDVRREEAADLRARELKVQVWVWVPVQRGVGRGTAGSEPEGGGVDVAADGAMGRLDEGGRGQVGFECGGQRGQGPLGEVEGCCRGRTV